MEILEQTLLGNWKEGYSLHFHTLSSIPLKNPDGSNLTDSNGNIKWDTKRPEIAEALYQLKYCKEQSKAETIAVFAANFLNNYKSKWNLDLIIPIPPSDTTRLFQPVYEMAKFIGKKLSLVVNFDIRDV